jgi:hypothetical protein
MPFDRFDELNKHILKHEKETQEAKKTVRVADKHQSCFLKFTVMQCLFVFRQDVAGIIRDHSIPFGGGATPTPPISAMPPQRISSVGAKEPVRMLPIIDTPTPRRPPSPLQVNRSSVGGQKRRRRSRSPSQSTDSSPNVSSLNTSSALSVNESSASSLGVIDPVLDNAATGNVKSSPAAHQDPFSTHSHDAADNPNENLSVEETYFAPFVWNTKTSNSVSNIPHSSHDADYLADGSTVTWREPISAPAEDDMLQLSYSNLDDISKTIYPVSQILMKQWKTWRIV